MTPSKRAAWLLALGALVLGLHGCAVLPPPAEREVSVAVPASANEPLGRIALQSVPAGQDSGFRPLPLANWSMDARLTLVREARKTLDLQFYLLQNDVTGHTLARAVRDAALRGVRVRLLVDDLYTAENIHLLLGLAAYPNVEVRLFNPFAGGRGFGLTRWLVGLNEFSRINHRMHNKLMVADGAFAIAGGRNMADEYFFSSKGGNFVDFDLLVAGAAVPRLAAIFDTYWNSPRIYPLDAIETARHDARSQQEAFEALTLDAIGAHPSPAPGRSDILGFRTLSDDLQNPPLKLLHGRVDVFADDPEKVSGRAERGGDDTTVTARVGKAMSEAKTEVLVGSPYFIPGQLGMDGLRAARSHGVKVEVMTNSLASNDEPFASAAYSNYRVPMLKLGAQLYETDSSQLKNDKLIGGALQNTVGRSHSKLIVIDRRTTFVGSMNMDFRSSRVNTELGMLVDSPELAEMVIALAARVREGSYRLRLAEGDGHLQWVGIENGAEKVWDSEPGVDFATRLQLLLLFPFISESLL
ncbi:MAG TPA: phospholipase D family protein [Burkholderiaceae bacterium]|nr:phospholipase D family protein [Burkholderiaceae bacterium]